MASSAQRSAWSLTSAAFAVAGALMVLLGAQLPVLEIRLLGAVDYYHLPGTVGAALPIAAAGALVAVVFRNRLWLALCALALWIALLWPVLRLGYDRLVADRGTLDQLGDALEDAMARAVGKDLLEVTRLREGLFVLLAGCLLVSVGALRRRRR